jgi:hypothetical protein
MVERVRQDEMYDRLVWIFFDRSLEKLFDAVDLSGQLVVSFNGA